MTWVIKVGGQEVLSDDFTLDDLGVVEKSAEVPWSTANPMRSAAVARAFLKIAVGKIGGNPQEVDSWTLGRIKRSFDFRADDEVDEEEVGEPVPLAPSSAGSSRGASAGSAGPHRKRDSKQSAT